MRQVSTGNYSQRFWPDVGGGSLDDCVILGDYRALHIVRPDVRLPTITAYRAAAGVPDTDRGIEGLSIDDSMEAVRALWPDVKAERYMGDFAGFRTKVKGGAAASASVLSSYLPAALRYGFNLNHRIVVFWNGEVFRIFNPLAPPHSKPQTITEVALRLAMEKYPSAEPAVAVLFYEEKI